MVMFHRFLSLSFLFWFPFTSYSQGDAEWLVEMNTTTGSFAAVGPSIAGVGMIYVNVQCKDEVNEQYLFVSVEATDKLIAVDISNGQVMDESPFPPAALSGNWGMHCYHDCDTILFILQLPSSSDSYVALYDRINGGEFVPLGDPIPYDDSGNWVPTIVHNALDRVNNLLYLYSPSTSTLRIMDLSTGEISFTYTVSLSPKFIEVDEASGKLYAVEHVGSDILRLKVFIPETGEFTQVGGNFFTIASGFSTPTIDANNQRFIITWSSSDYGSFMTSIDLNTGEVLADVQTIPGDPNYGLFGGHNTLNGQYFNSTDQLITLHWGRGESLSTSANVQPKSEFGARVFPNPNRGEFGLDLSDYLGELYGFKVVNLKGQVVYEKSNLRKGESLHLDLPPGHYTAIVFDANGESLDRIPFLIDANR